MCESSLIIENQLTAPDCYWFEKQEHSLIHVVDGQKHVLIPSFELFGYINYAAIHEVNNEHGIKSGYMIIVGEQ